MQPIYHTTIVGQEQENSFPTQDLGDENAEARTEIVTKRLRDEASDPTRQVTPTAKKRRIQPLVDLTLDDIDEQISETAAPIKHTKTPVSVDSKTRRKRSIWTKKTIQFVEEKIKFHQGLQTSVSNESTTSLHMLFSMLKLTRSEGIDASLADGPYKGANFVWLAAYFRECKIAFKILKLFPEIDVNATPQDPHFKGQTPLYSAITNRDWRHAYMLVENQPLIDWSVHPEETNSPLWDAAHKGEWKIVQQALDANRHLNINEAPKGGYLEGVTIFLLYPLA